MNTTVETASGRLEGREKDGILLFAGVPYAAPPVGPLRFAPPQPHPGWSGLRDATRFGPISVQGGDLLGGLFQGSAPETSEDCLFLNVQTPALDDARRPVMVWIHGGSFTGGSGSTPWYNGTHFAIHGDVVVVTLNYRLGALGFLHLADLAPELAMSGNSGLLDQIAALEWVRDNIERFGGNPDDVTLFGESAGGMSVATLLGAPRAAGLFHKAIPQSGAAHNVTPAAVAAEVTDRLLRALDVDAVAALREVPAERIYEVQVKVAGEVATDRLRQRRPDPSLPFGPVLDGELLPRPPLDAVRDGLSSDVPVMTGTTFDEWKLFELMVPGGIDESRLLDRAGRLFDDGETAVATYRANRPDASPDDLWSAMMTDRVFRIPAIRLAEAQAAHQPDHTFLYLFTWPTTAVGGKLRSCHALEIPFVFDNLHQPGVDFFTDNAAPQPLADAMHAAWLAFVHGAEPDPGQAQGWLPYDTARRSTMCFDTRSAPLDDPYGDERALWDGLR
jgi:para-nitrobenzyl esterase